MGKHTPPAADELELSLFGPGIGECLVIHLGNGDWMVVDSCLTEKGDKPVALDYLERLGVNVGTQLKIIVVTHWHDDHIRGVASLLSQASAAKFVCSGALRCDEFIELISCGSTSMLVDHTSGVAEFGRILQVLDTRAKAKGRAGPDCWAAEGSLIYRRTTDAKVDVYARSPSPQTVTDAKGRLAKLLPRKYQPVRRFSSTTPNDESIVLLIVTDQFNALLGGDLEAGRDDRRGWKAVLASSEKYSAKAHSYKIPHHGSENADCGEIWQELLHANPIAILTPYARGSKPLPSKSDVTRLKNVTQVCCTVLPSPKKPNKKPPAVDRTMKEVTRSWRTLRKAPGHIRIRHLLNNAADLARVELFDGAVWL